MCINLHAETSDFDIRCDSFSPKIRTKVVRFKVVQGSPAMHGTLINGCPLCATVTFNHELGGRNKRSDEERIYNALKVTQFVVYDFIASPKQFDSG